ncbi:MAG: 50S ribosomal protein L32 [Deltaproteobacteria bacterium]|nr:50S ribosomal protein L32 [Deltaproteobacteria bacterium]MBW2620233.1 50S ribosomal protein L32 [Deltaproteobacteria bacterium]
MLLKAVLKRKKSKSNRNSRKIHHRFAIPNRIACPQFGDAMLSHHVCPNCGIYKGRTVILMAS